MTPKFIKEKARHIIWKKDINQLNGNLIKLNITSSGIENETPYVLIDDLFFYGPYNRNQEIFLEKFLEKKVRNKICTSTIFAALHINTIIKESGDYLRHYNLKKGDIVVDAGANIGVITVIFSKKVGDTGKIIAIEPEEENLRLLEMNIKKHSLKNVIVIKKGLYCKKDKKLLTLHSSGDHTLYDKFMREGEKVAIEVDTLDNLLKELKIEKVDFIKMDIEGAEIDAIKGMEKTLLKKPKLVIAAYHLHDGEPTYKVLAPYLRELGYNIKIGPKGFIYSE